MLIRRHFWFVDPATLTLYQFVQMLASIDRDLYGPVVHIAKPAKS